MGRHGKLEIKKIEDNNNRQKALYNRRTGLFKKAHELAVLCEAEVAVIVFSCTGKRYEFASSSMKQTLARYKDDVGLSDVVGNPQIEDVQEIDSLKDEIAKLEVKQKRLLGKDLSGLSVEELRQMEKELSESLLSVTSKKEQLLLEQIERSRMQVKRVSLETEALRTQTAMLRARGLTSKRVKPANLEYYPLKSENNAISGPKSTLQFWPQCDNNRKRKSTDSERGSPTSSV